MEGDSQEFSYHVKEGADLEVLSQSFEKIHKMDEGSASRTISVQVDPHAVLYYYPQPVIPFAQSSFYEYNDDSSGRRDIPPVSAGNHLLRTECARRAVPVPPLCLKGTDFPRSKADLPRQHLLSARSDADGRDWYVRGIHAYGEPFFSHGQNTRIRFSMKSGKFLTAIRKSTAAQRRSPAAILLFDFRTPCAEAAADGGKNQNCV